jgi:cobaltochelatase CobN
MGVVRNPACCVAKAFELGFDPLDCASGRALDRAAPMALQKIDEQLWRTAGDTRERLELYAAWLIEQALDGRSNSSKSQAGTR